jgi:membrane fusion protein (multidrug efflux system)
MAKEKSKGKILIGVGVAVVVVLGALGGNWYINQKNYVTTDNAKVTGDLLNASPRMAGKVAEVKVAVGDQVKEGDVLFNLDTDQIKAQVAQAQAALDVAKAQLDKVAGGARSQEIAGAQALVDQAQAGYNATVAGRDAAQSLLNSAQDNYNKLLDQLAQYKNSNGDYDMQGALNNLNTLLAKGTIKDSQYTVAVQGIQQGFASKAQLEAQILQLKGQIKSANSQIDASKANVNGANDKLSLATAGASDKDLAVLQNQVKAAQATFDVANLSLSFAGVKAPASGTVVQVNVHNGDMVAAGQTGVAIVDMSKLQVSAYVLENDLERVKNGQTVDLSIDAFPGKKFSGKVKQVGLATGSVFNLFSTDNSSGNYTKVSQRVPVTIDFDYSGNPVIPGMSAGVKIKAVK